MDRTVVLEYLKVLLSPHLVLGGVLLFFLLRFAAVIEAALGRITSVEGPVGVKATFQEQARQAEAAKAEPKDIQMELAAATPDTAASTTPAAAAVTPAPKQGEEKKFSYLALQYWTYWRFEKIYRGIFRSQILLLQHLAASPQRRARWIQLLPFYQKGIIDAGHPVTSYPYGNYMNYLALNSLIKWNAPPGEIDPEVELTGLGQGFLQYITSQNYNIFERPF